MEAEAVIQPKRQPRKTIGSEGSRKQTLFLFLFLLILGLFFYLPQELKKLPQKPVTIVSNRPRSKTIEIVKSKPVKTTKAETEAKIKSLIDGLPGQYGIWAGAVDGGEKTTINAEAVYTAASVIKLPVLTVYYLAVDSGKLDPEEIYVLDERDRWQYGTGSMQNAAAGTEYTYKKIAQLVANQSDNMGAEILIKKLGGYSAVEKATANLLLKNTSLKDNETSPEDMGQLLQQLAQDKLLSQESREELFNNLTKTVNEDRLPAGVPDHVRVIHKFGSEAGVVNDCGIVEAKNQYVVCVLTTDINAGEAEAVLPQISELVWDWLGN